MRAIRHTFVFVFLFTWHIHITPACTGRQNDTARTQDSPIGHVHLHQATCFASRHNLVGTLQIHNVHFVVTHLRFQCCGKLRTIRLKHGNVIFNCHGVVGLSAKAFRRNTHTNAFTCCVDCRSSTCRTTTYYQNIERFFFTEFDSFAFCR